MAQEHDAPAPAAIECDGLSKSFEGVPVLGAIGARFEPGTVNVLAGENGAGKSTLFKIIAGQLTPDAGRLAIFGEPVRWFDPKHAQQLGIAIIPQELLPIPDMRVYENLLIGREKRAPFGFLRREAMIEEARGLLDSFELKIDPAAPMKRFGMAETQMIEILKATSRDAQVVLMDEPSSALSSRETEHLFHVIRVLRARGACILYTSHRMEEIEIIADTVAVMRDGTIIRHAPAASLSERQIVADMVGRELDKPAVDKHVRPAAEVALSVRELRRAGTDAAVSFELRRGEILGLGGLVGAGRSELLEAIFGIRKASGMVLLGGKPLPLGRPIEAIRRGVAFVPEDRKLAGVLTSMSVLDNVTLPHLRRFTGAGLVRNELRRHHALEMLTRTKAKYAHLGQLVGHLSGGNQQKIAIARWLMAGRPELLILDEPTRGIDVGARSELYRLINELADDGVAVLLASSDMPELIALSHRILVLWGGRIMGELGPREMDQERILRLAMGQSQSRDDSR